MLDLLFVLWIGGLCLVLGFGIGAVVVAKSGDGEPRNDYTESFHRGYASGRTNAYRETEEMIGYLTDSLRRSGSSFPAEEDSIQEGHVQAD